MLYYNQKEGRTSDRLKGDCVEMKVITIEGKCLLVKESDMSWSEPWVYLYDDDTRYGNVSLYEHYDNHQVIAVIPDSAYPA